MSTTLNVLHDVYEERERQEIKFGDAERDNGKAYDEWVALIMGRIQREPLSRRDEYRLLVEVAALAVAAAQWSLRTEGWPRRGVAP